MAVIEHVEATPAERAAYLKRSVAERRVAAGIGAGEDDDIAPFNEEVGEEADISEERYQFAQHEQFSDGD